jgi:tRNA(Ile2) C34 agmatinyltransferase TiaS
MYFLNAPRTLCHMIEDMRTGKAPDPCGSKAHKSDILRYQKGEPNKLLKVKPQDIPLCKHCQRGTASAG